MLLARALIVLMIVRADCIAEGFDDCHGRSSVVRPIR